MYKLCVFGGTTEGRELVEFLNTQPCRVTACVATEYGQTLLPEGENLTVSARPLPVGEIGALLQAERFDLVIDATHPYAASITRSIAAACEAAGVEHWRLLRGASEAPEDAVFAENTDEAVRFLSGTEGNILLTTGSKELSKFAALPDFAARCWARVLPLPASLEACSAAGLSPSHIFALQGPFSREMDEAMLHRTGARWLVTKDGGAAGGFQEKAAAGRHAGARLLVIGRPTQETGSSLPETIGALCARFGFSCRPRVTVVGIGPGSEAAQTGEVRAAIRAADALIGARRMLEAVAQPGQLALDAIAPEAIADRIREHPQCRRFTVVMSGDTGFFSGTKKLLPLLQDCETTVLPGLSSLSYLCARLGVSYESVVPVSLHGRVHDIVPDVRRNKTVFVLVGGEGGMAAELAEQTFDKLSVALLENPSPDAVVTHGLPDERFQRSLAPGHVVPMTKSEVRSVCLSKLQLTADAVCWDVGAGTGSVAIEMALQAARGSVWAIEREADALALLEQNRAAFGAENLRLVSGSAPEACRELPAPTHAFLGGTGGQVREILQLLLEKNPHVRIVATAVTLESAAALTACMREFEFSECVSLSIAKARAAGPYHLMAGQNPIYIFTLQNGGNTP